MTRSLTLVVVLSSALSFAVDYVNDPLTASSMAGRGSRGGSFGPTGWTVSAEDDTFWYEIDEALPTARVEFTITGLSIGPGGSLSGADHDILTVYQAPTGMPEPIAYAPYFRSNDFKAFIRIFGNQESGREGAMKLELAACPRGSPWFHDEACPAGCEISGIGYANGRATDVGWNAASSYRMAVEWGGGGFRVYRDGALIGTVPISGDYAPRPLRIRFGGPRHQGVYPGIAMMPLGITIKDVVVTGTPGTMTPQCGAMPPTGGGGGSMPPVGGGAGGGGGGAPGGAVGALQDVTAASWESGVFSDPNDLNVEGGQSVVYLRFPSFPNGVDHAQLVVHTQDTGSAAGGSGRVCVVADDAWSETAMTWSSRPALGACVGAERSVDSDADVDWDVTSLVQPGKRVNLAIVSTDSNGAHFWSKEAGRIAPKLVVVESMTPPVVDAGTPVQPPVDAGQPELDAGQPPIVGVPPAGQPGQQPAPLDAPGNIDARGGCGCSGGGGVALLALLVPLWSRRRAVIASRARGR
ncbi:MAG: DNRLRE domain-containing protein [Myxococcaceae bacterium]